MNVQVPLWKVGVLLLASWLIFAGPKGCTLPSISSKVTAVTYVHQRETPVPSGVRLALDEFNHRSPPIMATAYEVEDGATPKQYVVPFTAAQAAGLPSLVSTGGDKVIKVIKDPKTYEDSLKVVP